MYIFCMSLSSHQLVHSAPDGFTSTYWIASIYFEIHHQLFLHVPSINVTVKDLLGHLPERFPYPFITKL